MIEYTKLNKKNIPYIAKRSGKTELELEAMRLAMKEQNREITLRYEVIGEADNNVAVAHFGDVE